MQGDTVIVRTFGGTPLVRRVWESTPETVYICTEERFQRLLKEQEEIPPTGFPREYVFYYDPSLNDLLTKDWKQNPSLWDELRVYEEAMHQ